MMRRAISLQEELVSEYEGKTALRKVLRSIKAIDHLSWKGPWKSSNPNSPFRWNVKVTWAGSRSL